MSAPAPAGPLESPPATRAVVPGVAALVHRAAVAAAHLVVHPKKAQPAVKPPTAALADDPPPQPGDQTEHARNGGVVEGQVVSVDYQSGMIGLMTPDRGRVDVMVLPSTNIQGKGDSFHTIADIARGSRLRVFLSRRAGQLFAQIIHLR